jgi:site-specific DNA-methyltransferase (adenine-specific)
MINIKSQMIEIKNEEGFEYLSRIKNNSIDLVLTDPPYITSTESGMNTLYKKVKENEEKGIEFIKTEEEWECVKSRYKEKDIPESVKKSNYMHYGNIYGKKYAVKTDYGDWDKNFNMDILDKFVGEYYKKLRKGGTIIIFFDLWKITALKDILEKHKFKQLRFIEWIKTNPQPLNSKTNYLTNCREIAILAVKDGKPTFNSSYDNAIYNYPLQGGKNRFHPTQKSLPLFEAIIKKHSNEGDTVLDTFLGSGTTALACINTNRNFKGCELNKEYCQQMVDQLGLKIDLEDNSDTEFIIEEDE